MVHVSVQVVSSYVTPWLSNTCLISVISFVITLSISRLTMLDQGTAEIQDGFDILLQLL
jgi:hypothetical protein